ncbi:Gfo/Idh/MocA family protein [Microbacterium sp. LWO12-1.2]|uniref:Gfo/Idh/MocA family protein n=1 Tax=Microbacterium sp. LWO12-1.2 TaxID=3135261 RepID=UPI00343CED83
MGSEQQQTGFAIVGAGGIALSHAGALARSTRGRLVSVCDTNARAAEQLAAAHGARPETEFSEVLTDADVDAVILCTPNRTHVPLGRAIIEAGKHLLLEKPLALTSADAELLVRRAEDLGRVLVVGHTHRHSDQARAIAELVHGEEIGEIRYIHIVMNGGWLWGGWSSWVLDRAQSGGHALHNGVHLMDLAAWWMNDRPIAVRAVGQKVTSAALAIHDYLVIDLRFANGAVARCEISRAEIPRDSSFTEMRVVGSAGAIERRWDSEGLLAWTDRAQGAWSPGGAVARSFSGQIERFIDAIADASRAFPPARDSLEVIRWAEAAEESLATGCSVTIGDLR